MISSPADLQKVMCTDYQLSAQQWAAVAAPLEPAVVIAGAGSGKTSLMAARVVYLVATGKVVPDEVLGLTFTTKATAELRGRIRDSLDAAGLGRGIGEYGEPGRLEPTVSTYNAYAASLLSEHGLRIGHEPDTRVMADASRYQLAARVVDRHRAPVRQLTDSPTHVIDYLLQLDAAMSEHLVAPGEVRDFHRGQRLLFQRAVAEEQAGKARKTYVDAVSDVLTRMDQREELVDLVEEYRALKQQLGLMDFSDQIALAARLVAEHPDVGAAERAKFKVVLLDEYQDTSVAQARLLATLFAGQGHPVTAVGDPNQAIYGWRGASVSNILEFGQWFPGADGRAVSSYPLTVNRRSDTRILEVANRLAAPLHAEFDQVEPLQAPAGAAVGEVRASVHETFADELAWLPGQVVAARQAMAEPSWRGIGVLTRDNATAAEVFDALASREIPVEIVGLQGLLRLPEVAEVVSTLALLHDLTRNADLLTLLNGPRWAIGPRDLALLGRRAQQLAGRQPHAADLGVTEGLARAVDGADPTELVSLCDALDDPGDAAYSAEAQERFALLSAELRMLRRHVGEPLLDLVRRIIDTSGLDIELASSVSPAAAARRDNLDLFVKAVAEFQAVDGTVTLPALLAYLQAEDEMGTGLDVATPSEADSVKLLTVHRAKGLEWDAVFLVGVCEEKFPSTRTRSQWTTGCWVLPAPLRGDAADVPQLRGHDKAALDRLKADARAHEAQEELRLGYVAFTRARHRLSVSSYLWRPDRQKPLGPSAYQQVVREQLADWGELPERWRDRPERGTPNPLEEKPVTVPWPVTTRTREAELRVAAASLVRAAAADTEDPELDMVESARVQEWDDELDRLLAEARADRADVVEVPLPSSVSATAMARLRDDPAAFARELARPMPRPPSPAARFGTRFHAWVEARFGQQGLIEPDDLPGRADQDIDDEDELRELVKAFESGPFADRPPHRLEAPFALVLAGQVVRGRIDAVYAEPDSGDDGSWLVVDWKTNRRHDADPLQLAIYRVAWAELAGVPVSRVRAAFVYVRDGELVVPPDLPDRAGLERLVTG